MSKRVLSLIAAQTIDCGWSVLPLSRPAPPAPSTSWPACHNTHHIVPAVVHGMALQRTARCVRCRHISVLHKRHGAPLPLKDVDLLNKAIRAKDLQTGRGKQVGDGAGEGRKEGR